MRRRFPFPAFVFKQAAFSVGKPHAPRVRFTLFHIVRGALAGTSILVFIVMRENGYSFFIATTCATIIWLIAFLSGMLLAPLTLRTINAGVDLSIIEPPDAPVC